MSLTGRRGEEVEEGIILDSLGDSTDHTTVLMLLFLLQCLQRNVFALIPVDGATTALVNFGPLETKRILRVRIAFHIVLFC